MEDTLKDLQPAAAKVMKLALECEDGELFIRRREGGYVLENRFESAFEYDLTLLDGAGLPEECDGWSVWPGELRREGAGYILTATAENYSGEGWQEVTLTFSGAEARVRAVRADLEQWHARPWMQLSSAAYGIARKADCFPELLSDEERALLPLLRELGKLNFWGAQDEPGFPELKKRFPPELVKCLGKLEKSRRWERNMKLSGRLQGILNRSNYEPLWITLWDELAQTQSRYPAQEQSCAEWEPSVTAWLHARGYEGAWPDYVRRGTIQKTRLVRSHGRRYLVRKGRDAVFYIRCQGSAFGSDTYLTMLCATELPEGASPKGFDSCRFDRGGRSFLSAIQPQGELEDRLALAVKKAELLPLTKQERKNEGQISPLPVFLWTFLLVGGFSAAVFTLGTGLLCLGITLLLQGPGGIAGMLTELPWMQLFAGSWVLAGGTVGAILAYLTSK